MTTLASSMFLRMSVGFCSSPSLTHRLSESAPPLASQPGGIPAVACHVSFKFSVPVLFARFRPVASRTATVPVPKTAVNKNDLLTPREDEIGRAWKFVRVQAISKAHSMNRPSDDQFGLAVLAADTRHQDASLRLCQLIHRLCLRKTL